MFAKARFGLNQGEASVFLLVIGAGAVPGTLLAGRLSDWLIFHHHVSARPTVAAACYLLAVAMFLPGLLDSSLLVAVALLFLAVIGVGGANPALDAARLDVMPSRLLGPGRERAHRAAHDSAVRRPAGVRVDLDPARRRQRRRGRKPGLGSTTRRARSRPDLPGHAGSLARRRCAGGVRRPPYLPE